MELDACRRVKYRKLLTLSIRQLVSTPSSTWVSSTWLCGGVENGRPHPKIVSTLPTTMSRSNVPFRQQGLLTSPLVFKKGKDE
jgi:hypothetical protein